MKQYLTKLETVLDLYFGKKAPALPENIKEAIVKYGPYLTILVIVLSFPGLLLALGITALASPFAYMGYNYGTFTVTGLFLLGSLILNALAVPGLFKRTRSAWNLMFYSSLLSALYQLLILNLGGLIIGTAISFYFLFQIKSYYR